MPKRKQKGMKWLREKMNELGYDTLQEVAEKIGINRGNLYRYFSLETKPSVAMLPILAKVFKTDYEEVLYALGVQTKTSTKKGKK
jgi:transcriptional regulator with XRE-family HTH domain